MAYGIQMIKVYTGAISNKLGTEAPSGAGALVYMQLRDQVFFHTRDVLFPLSSYRVVLNSWFDGKIDPRLEFYVRTG